MIWHLIQQRFFAFFLDIGHVSQGFVSDSLTTQKNASSIFCNTDIFIRLENLCAHSRLLHMNFVSLDNNKTRLSTDIRNEVQ